MTPKKEEGNDARPLKMFGIILPSLPVLMVRFGRLFLRFKLDAKKGGKVFHKQLLKSGIDETTATELTNIYLETSNLKQYLQLWR